MDTKTVNFILVIIGIILALTGGVAFILAGYTVYLSAIIGVVLIIIALYGLKKGRVF